MEIFKELIKKGYKHYYGGTIEELDNINKNNPDLHSEIMQVVMWLYDKHGVWIYTSWGTYYDKTVWYYYTSEIGKKSSNSSIERFNSPTEAYEAAIEYCLKELI